MALVTLGAAAVAFAAPSGAQTDEVSGAFGFRASVGLFGGPPNTVGPVPTVTLPAAGSAAPVTATEPTGKAQFGPAVIFSSGPLEVSAQGTTGAGGSVTSSTKVTSVNTSGQEVFTASEVTSTCTAAAAGVTGSATIAGGKLRISEGTDFDSPTADADDTIVDVPANPAPNTVVEGALESIPDTFRYIFNEQVKNADGSITVNAAHQVLIGPTAVGDVFIGQSRCILAAGSSPTTAAGTATTVPAGGQTGSATTVAGRTVANTGTGALSLLLPATALMMAGATALLLARRRRVAQAVDLPHGRP